MGKPENTTSPPIAILPIALFIIFGLGLLIYARAAYPLVSDDFSVFQSALPLIIITWSLIVLVSFRLHWTNRLPLKQDPLVHLAAIGVFSLVGVVPFSVGLTQLINGTLDQSPVAVRVVKVIDKAEAYSSKGQSARCVYVTPWTEGEAPDTKEVCVVYFNKEVFTSWLWQELQHNDILRVYTQAGALGLERLLAVERMSN